LLGNSHIVLSASMPGPDGKIKWMQIVTSGDEIQLHHLIQQIGQGLVDGEIIVGLGFMDSIVEMVEQAKRDFENLANLEVTSEYHYLNYIILFQF